VLGGRWRSAALGGLTPPSLDPPSGAGIIVETSATAIGLYDDARGRHLVVVVRRGTEIRLRQIYAERFLIAVGGHSALLPFENNDLPGVLSGSAASALVRRRGILPAKEVAVVGRGESLYTVAALLETSGAKLTALVDLDANPPPSAPKLACHGTVREAHGRSRVSGLSYQRADGKKVKARCQALVVCLPPSPSFELARQGGAKVEFDEHHGTFVVESDAQGRTATKAVFVAGTQRGGLPVDASSEHGREVARAIQEGL
jgi:sarcosine oxidase subunit alpha